MKTIRLLSKRVRVALLVLLLCAAGMTKTNAQSTVGKDFWVTFLPNYDGSDINLSLIATGSSPCSGTILNPNTNWSTEFEVSVGTTTIIDIPLNEAYSHNYSDCILNTGLHITSTDSISLYASNFMEHSFDVTDVLPISSMGSNYIIQTYPNDAGKNMTVSPGPNLRSLAQGCTEFSVVATENNTTINITLTCNSDNGHYANQPFSVTLNAGQCYQVKSITDGDFSGSQISVSGNKKVAVFAGNSCANVPSNCAHCDHIVEQMLPTSCWGTRFVVTGSSMRSFDVVRVTSLNNNCQIFINNTLVSTINEKQTYQFEITSNNPSLYLETSEPAMVYLYFSGDGCGGINGDPSMVMISPIEQRMDNITFSTFNSGASQYHFVNVITNTDEVSNMLLDGNSIASEFQPVNGNSTYSFARVSIEHGSHTLSTTGDGFVAHVYGLGERESYAYSVGTRTINLSTQMIVNGQLASDFPDGFDICKNEPVYFNINANFDVTQANWTFGDGQTGTGSPISHQYDIPGNYTVSCDVYKLKNGQDTLVATVTTELHVYDTYQTELSETHCDSYTWMGETYTLSGDYEYLAQTIYGCDSLLTLHLTINHSDTTYLNISSCEEYEWYGTTYTASGVYEHLENNAAGCDSLIILDLTISQPEPLGDFTYMNPTNNYPFTSFPIEFSWDAVSGTQHYDLYLWNANDPMPEEPFVSGLTNGYYRCSSLPNHQTYQWYVKAYNPCNAINSDIRAFTLDVEPELNVNMQSINFGEVALNQSTSSTLQVSGIVLEDNLNIEITGEDAAMFSFTESTNWDSLSGGNLIVTFTPTVAQYAYNANLVISSGTLSQTVALSGSLADYFVFHTYVDEEVYPMNNFIPIHGDLMDANGNPVPDAEVEIGIFVMGMKRTLQATTNEDGQFSAIFEPMPSESGYYTVNSGIVGNNNTVAHDEFNIPGMAVVTNDYILCAVTQDQPKTDSILIRNKCNLQLNNIQLSTLSAPEGCSFSFSPLSLGGLEEGYLVYTVTGSTLTQGNYYQEVRLKAASSEGAETVITIWYYCMEPRGVLDVAPKTLATTMTKGKSKIVDVMLSNNGTSATGNIFIDLPDVEWMSVVGNDTLPSLAVNDTAYFSLRFSPNEDIQLGQYSGAIAINCEHGEFVTLPYQIIAVSDSTGTLVIDVTDEYTWNTNGGFGPHLANAEVTLTGYFSLETVAHGYTDENGIFNMEQLPEGYYRLRVNADKHSEYDNVILIEAGSTNQRDVFIQYQGVTYSWNVVPTEIQDQYTFELISTFETNVPAPVVTIEAPHNLPAFDESYTFNYVITNHGLISANDVVLHTPEDDDFLFTALYDHIDTLAAQTTIVIPCLVTYKDTISKSQRGECADWGYTWVEYTYECKKDGTFGHGYGYAYTLLGTYPCENTPPSIGGGGVPFLGIVGGGGSGFPNPFFTSPLLEMWYDCYNGCTHLVLVAAEQLLQACSSSIGVAYSVLKATINLANDELLQSSFNGGSAAAKLMGCSKLSGVLSVASAIPDLLKDIPECYKYLHDSYGWKDFQIEYLEYVPDEIREMIVYALEYSEKLGKLYNYFEMYYGNVTWLESDLDELDNFMELVFDYDSIYGHVTVDPSLLARKPSNIDENQVQVFIERYNNTRDLLKGMPVSGDNYMPIDSLYTIMATILGVEYEALSLGYESGADRLTHLINNAVDYLKDNQSTSVCAKVTVQFSQKMTMTREAFEGTFTVHNGHDTNAMEGIGLDFTVKDEDGNDCTNLFQINTTFLTNLTAIDGSGSLGAGMDGMAKILFIPTKEAAPIESKVYYFGGTFSFIDPFYLDTVTMDLYPVDLTVHPSPDLYVDYFMQRDILGDDALTLDKVEPSIPAELGVIINNKGAGVAKNVILETAEPKIIDNDKGLAIDFAMYGASFNGNEVQLGLMEIPFGNIESGHTAVGEWMFTSSLLGHFVSYEAHVIHNNSYGNPNLSLVSHLDIHELIHPIRAYGDLDDGINDFLVNDVADYYDYPDSIYFSHGGRTGVGLIDNIHFDHYVTPIDTIVTLTIHPSRIGWNYGFTDDPGTDKYELVGCTRNFDNQAIPLNNIWQTFVTLRDASDPIYENKLHIVDTLSNDDQDYTYTLIYSKKRELLKVEEIIGIPECAFIEYPLESFSVKFNKPIADSTFTYEDMVLKCNNGSNLMDSSVVISKIYDDLYNVNISGLTLETGYYVLNVHTLNINDAQGYNGYDGKQATWIQVLNGDKFVYINEDQTICENDNFEPLTSMVVGNAVSYQWNQEGLPIEGANEPEYQAVEAGIYTLTVTFEDGETATSNEVTLVAYPIYQITIDDEICEGEDYTLNGFNLTNLSFGIHDETLNFQNIYGCDSIISLHLVVHENPEVHIQIDTINDNGISFRLTATGATSCQWSTGETTVSIIVSPTEETTYSVIGTNGHGCSDNAEITVSGGTGIGENAQMYSVELYPNPAHDKLFVKTSEPIKTIEIFTMTGTLVQRQSCWSDNMEINVQSLSPGMYVIRLVSDHAIETRRFVKE